MRYPVRREQAESDFWADTEVDLRLMEAATAGASEQTESVTITFHAWIACSAGSSDSPVSDT